MSQHADLLLNLGKLIEKINSLPDAEPKPGVKLTKNGLPDKRASSQLSEERKEKLRSNAKSARDAAREIWMKRDGPKSDPEPDEFEYEFRRKEPKVEAKKTKPERPTTPEPKPEKPKRKRYVKRAVVVDVTDNDTSDADFYKPEPPKPVVPNVVGFGSRVYDSRNALKHRIVGKYIG